MEYSDKLILLFFKVIHKALCMWNAINIQKLYVSTNLSYHCFLDFMPKMKLGVESCYWFSVDSLNKYL